MALQDFAAGNIRLDKDSQPRVPALSLRTRALPFGSSYAPVTKASSSVPAYLSQYPTALHSKVPPYTGTHTTNTLSRSTPVGRASSTSHLSSTTSTPPLPPPPPPPITRSNLSHGELAAAVVVPVFFVAVIAILSFCCLRRRRHRHASDQFPAGFSRVTPGEMSMAGSALDPLKTKDQPPATLQPWIPPLITAESNNAYFSGIDTLPQSPASLRGGNDHFARNPSEISTTVEAPPPPYQAKSHSDSSKVSSIVSSGGSAGLPPNDHDRLPIPNFGTTFAGINHHGGMVGAGSVASPQGREALEDIDLSPPRAPALTQRPGVARSTSRQSITSTLYSDTASLHSAHAAEPVRVGVVANARKSTNESRSNSDPFVDPNSRKNSE